MWFRSCPVLPCRRCKRSSACQFLSALVTSGAGYVLLSRGHGRRVCVLVCDRAGVPAAWRRRANSAVLGSRPAPVKCGRLLRARAPVKSFFFSRERWGRRGWAGTGNPGRWARRSAGAAAFTDPPEAAGACFISHMPTTAANCNRRRKKSPADDTAGGCTLFYLLNESAEQVGMRSGAGQ